MKVLGIHDGHNASVAYVDDGILRFAIQEERINRIKNYWGFPFEALSLLLSEFGLANDRIDAVVFSSAYMPRGTDTAGLLKAYGGDNSYYNIFRNWMAEKSTYKKITGHQLRGTASLKKNKSFRSAQLRRYEIGSQKVKFVDHHLSHASAAYYGLRRDDGAYLVLTLDGGGDGLCATVSIGESGRIRRISETAEGHSIGNIYSRITFLMGFVPWEHEYKLMGMAPYASPEASDRIRRTFSSYVDLDSEEPIRFKRRLPEPTGYITKRLERAIQRKRFDQVCGGLQLATEDLVVRWVKACVKRTGIRRILCSGGVFMNVKANKRLFELPEVETIDVFPSCGDETNAIGAAFWWAEESGDAVKRLSHFYTGPHFNGKAIRQHVEKSNLPHRYYEDINEKVAELLSTGEIVARCSGPMEFGARALGNRSILANAGDYDNVRVINQMIKKRDFWMPFAPVIKEERMHEYIVNAKDIESPYMMFTYDTKEKRSEFMAATHSADLTARAQTLTKEQNPDFYDLLSKYEEETGSGVLLNTSFNLHGYPIVLGPREAIDVFLNSGLRYLVLENFLIWKD